MSDSTSTLELCVEAALLSARLPILRRAAHPPEVPR